MELDVVLRGIKQLLSPSRGVTSGLQSLTGNLDTFEVFLQQSSQIELKAAVQSTIHSLEYPEHREVSTSQSHTDDVTLYCRFTVQGLALLCMLDEAFKKANTDDCVSAAKFKELSASLTAQEAKQLTPPTPKALLSPVEEKSVNTLLQFVVALGIFPFLVLGADKLLTLKLGQMTSQIRKSDGLLATNACYLYHCCRTLTRMFTTPVIGTTVLSRHLSDVLMALLQICYGPRDQEMGQQQLHRSANNTKTPASNSEEKGDYITYPVLTEVQRNWCTEELSGLLNKLHQPLVIRELLTLQGAPGRSASVSKQSERASAAVRPGTPRWLQGACGRLLSERLMQKDGVRKVLLGICDAMPGGEEMGSGCHGDWKRVQAVAHIISSCPLQASSLTHYYSTIAPQLLGLLSSPAVACVQVAAATISLMMKRQPALARAHLLDPLTRPLRLVTAGTFTDHLPTGSDIEISITNLHRLCVAVEPSSPILVSLQPLLPVFFELWRASNESKRTCEKLRSEVTALLFGVLNSMDSPAVILFLRHLAGMPLATRDTIQWVSVSPSVAVEWPSEGSTLCVRSVCGGEEGRWSVERMESVGQAVLKLVRTELKSCRQLLGQFFIECLTCVVAILCLDINYQTTQLPSVQKEMERILSAQTTKTSDSASSVLLDIEEKLNEPTQAEAFQRSLALYLTAALSENATSEVLEQADTAQLLSLLSVIVECHACVVMRQNDITTTSPSSPLNFQPDLDQMLGGPITLSIALGYLSAVLSGAKQAEKEHRLWLSGLLQPLETISTRCPDPELSALAGDLRVCIATLGAVWSAELRETAEGGRGGGVRGKVLSGLTQEQELSEIQEELLARDSLQADKDNKAKHKLIEEIPEVLHLSQPAPTQPSPKRKENANPTDFQQALQESHDHEIPVKGHGLASLARLIEAGDKEAADHSGHLLDIFKANLHNPDSYVYLPAIRGLVMLASKQPLRVLTILCEGYAMFSKSHSSGVDDKKVDKETGQLKAGFKKQGCTKQSGRKAPEICAEDSLELRLKLGEAIVLVARECGEMLPYYADTLLPAVLSNARDPHPLIRASALSNLADICQLLGHSFGNYHHEILSCVSQLLVSDSTPQVQQAALLVFNLLLKGLSHHTISILGDSLRDVYRLLKRVEGERGKDELTRTHARAALGELDNVMRDWAFPQQALTKNISIHPGSSV